MDFNNYIDLYYAVSDAYMVDQRRLEKLIKCHRGFLGIEGMPRPMKNTTDTPRVYVSFANKKFHNVRFKGKGIYNADFHGSSFGSSSCNSVEFHKSNFTDVNAWKCDFSNADFSGCDLTRAYFNECDLRSANFSGAELIGTRFIKCKLDGAAFDESVAHRPVFNGSTGMFDPIEFMANHFERTEEGYIAYKIFDGMYKMPEDWDIKPGSVIAENANLNPFDNCGCGINVAPLEWVRAFRLKNDAFDQPIWRCLIRWEWLPGVVVPFGTNGKIRCNRVEILDKFDNGATAEERDDPRLGIKAVLNRSFGYGMNVYPLSSMNWPKK